MPKFMPNTYRVAEENEILSPALLYYKDIIAENTRKTVAMAGGAARLWPHVKSHKMREMLEMQMEMGISRFKCATLAEAALCAERGAGHVLLAYPLVGPSIPAFLALCAAHPSVRFYALGDDCAALAALSEETARRGLSLGLFVDVNMGMNRTGVEIARLADFVAYCHTLPGLVFSGLHCYDGHVHTTNRTARGDEVEEMLRAIGAAVDLSGVPMVIAGGSPTFPCHAEHPGFFLSPGTVFLWDSGYAENYPDLPFVPGAAVLTRVVSHPKDGLFTLDLGCKGIASDPPGLRGTVVGLEHAAPLFQSEEHWTFRMDPGFEAARPAIGTVFYVLPTHICPTTALYSAAHVVENGRGVGQWRVAARR